MKRTFYLLLACLLLLGATFPVIHAETTVASGTCGAEGDGSRLK